VTDYALTDEVLGKLAAGQLHLGHLAANDLGNADEWKAAGLGEACSAFRGTAKHICAAVTTRKHAGARDVATACGWVVHEEGDRCDFHFPPLNPSRTLYALWYLPLIRELRSRATYSMCVSTDDNDETAIAVVFFMRDGEGGGTWVSAAHHLICAGVAVSSAGAPEIYLQAEREGASVRKPPSRVAAELFDEAESDAFDDEVVERFRGFALHHWFSGFDQLARGFQERPADLEAIRPPGLRQLLTRLTRTLAFFHGYRYRGQAAERSARCQEAGCKWGCE